MPWGVGDDELAFGGGKVAIGYINGDSLFAFGAQPIGEQRQVHIGIAAIAAGALNSLQLIFKDGLAVIEQATDQGAFAIVHTTCRGKAQEIHGVIGIVTMEMFLGCCASHRSLLSSA